jgi:hypothetical protein
MKTKPANVVRLVDVRARRKTEEDTVDPVRTMEAMINGFSGVLLDQLALVKNHLRSGAASKTRGDA